MKGNYRGRNKRLTRVKPLPGKVESWPTAVLRGGAATHCLCRPWRHAATLRGLAGAEGTAATVMVRTQRGGLCLPGWSVADTLVHPERSTTPLGRAQKGAQPVPAGWSGSPERTLQGRLRGPASHRKGLGRTLRCHRAGHSARARCAAHRRAAHRVRGTIRGERALAGRKQPTNLPETADLHHRAHERRRRRWPHPGRAGPLRVASPPRVRHGEPPRGNCPASDTPVPLALGVGI